MSLLNFLILALATRRLTHLFLYESGPFALFRELRKLLRAGEFQADNPDFDEFTDEELEWWLSTDKLKINFLSELFSCPFCLSIWIGALIGWSGYFYPNLIVLLLPFSLSEIAILDSANALNKLPNPEV